MNFEPTNSCTYIVGEDVLLRYQFVDQDEVEIKFEFPSQVQIE